MFTPLWVKDAIFYQIFPERFDNGDRSNDPPRIQPWGDTPTGSGFFGGDLQGVLNRLPYLIDLGINTLYFNPIFSATSNHKYNATDYLKVDPSFGTNELFKKLLDACHAHHIRVVLDGVFNHVGTSHFAFVDVKEKGAASQYATWFNIFSYPVSEPRTPNYEGWWGYGALPKLMVANPDVQKYLFDVARYWTGMGIDGWRLDVPNEVPHAFWKEWRKLVKSINPDCYIVGELWQDASPWLKGDEFDATMNYRFRDACLDFFCREKTTADEFQKSLQETRALYPDESNFAMQNLIDSHDTERYLTLCKGDIDKLKLTVLFQMAYLGAPMIYYGDEIGMEGGKDPDCRRTMIWDEKKWNKNLRGYYKKLIAARKKFAALRHGSYAVVPMPDAHKNVTVFERAAGHERMIVVINNSSKKAALSIPAGPGKTSAADVMKGTVLKVKNGTVSVAVPAMSGMMIEC
jgi:cyclomaltodextrinase / maltogenic alpha-amylase / neopullulanase